MISQTTIRFFFISGLMAVVGACTAAAIAVSMSHVEAEIVFFAAPGAFVGGLCTVWAFGYRGKLGVLVAMVGAVLATVIGATTAGGILLLEDGANADLWVAPVAAAFVVEALVDRPAIGILWITLMSALHFATLKIAPKGGRR